MFIELHNEQAVFSIDPTCISAFGFNGASHGKCWLSLKNDPETMTIAMSYDDLKSVINEALKAIKEQS